MDYEISEKELAPQLALTHRRTVTMPTIAENVGAGFGVLMEHAGKTGAQWAGPPFILYPEDCSDEYEIVICMPVVPGARGGEGVERGGDPRRAAWRPRRTWGRIARSARPTRRCRSG